MSLDRLRIEVTCRFHLEAGGGESDVLDVAAWGGVSLDEIAELLSGPSSSPVKSSSSPQHPPQHSPPRKPGRRRPRRPRQARPSPRRRRLACPVPLASWPHGHDAPPVCVLTISVIGIAALGPGNGRAGRFVMTAAWVPASVAAFKAARRCRPWALPIAAMPGSAGGNPTPVEMGRERCGSAEEGRRSASLATATSPGSTA